MSAITPSVTSGEGIGALSLNDERLRRFTFSSIANADTFASGITSVVTYAIFSATKAIFATQSAGTFTFTVTSGPATDAVLYVWSKDY